MRNTLLLNSTWEPLQVLHWKKSIILALTDKVEVLEYHEEQEIKTSSGGILMPSVSRLWERAPFRREEVKFNKLNLFARDGFQCQYCGDTFSRSRLTFDHVLPRSRGGKTAWDNITTSCRPCNQYKDDLTPEEAGMELLTIPKKPIWTINNIIVRVQNRPEEWDKYLW